MACWFWAIATGSLLCLAAGGLPAGFPAVPTHGVKEVVAFPLFGIGTWQYNDSVAAFVVESAFRFGYRHVDTAYIYDNQVGVGQALRKLGLPRSDYFVTSKIPGGLNSTMAVQALDESLQQLGLQYVDLMLLHFPFDLSGKGSPDMRREEWRALEAWAGAGKARAIGVSHYCKHHLEDILDIAALPVAVNQVQYHVGMGTAGPLATDDKAFTQRMGILYQSFSPLCGPCDPPDNKELVTGRLVTQIGQAHGKSGPQVALRWLVQQGIPVIPKSRSPAHIKENMEIFDFALTEVEMAQLTAATRPAVGGGPGPADSGDCGVTRILFA